MKKKGILLVVLLLAVGFAAVTTTLFINGTIGYETNKSDFEVYYSKTKVNGVLDNSVITDDTHIVFTHEMKSVGETYVLDYDVTNGSRNYDADLTMTCTESNEYLSVTNVFDTDTNLPATETRTGKLTIELIKGYAGEETKEVTIECTINANAVERSTLSEGTPAESVFQNYTITFDSQGGSAEDSMIVTTNKKYGELPTPTKLGYIFDGWYTEKNDGIKIENTSIVNISDNLTLYANWIDDGTYPIGKTYTIGTEGFHVIRDNEDTVTLFADYNLGTDYKQSTSTNYVTFSNNYGWEYRPGPKEIDIQSYDGNAKTYINNYVNYLKTQVSATDTDTLIGNLITVTELINLGCTLKTNYEARLSSSDTCVNSEYFSWINNGQYFWTSSACSNLGWSNDVWNCGTYGCGCADNDYNKTIRPVITISKSLI